MKRFAFSAVAAFGLLAAACTTPEPAPQPEPTPDPGPVVDTTPDPVPTGPVPGSPADFEATAGDRVFYGFDQSTLTSEARATLSRQAAWLSSYPSARILIAGTPMSVARGSTTWPWAHAAPTRLVNS